MLAKINAQLTASPQALVKLGRALMGSGQGDKAVAILCSAAAERPDDPDIASAVQAVLSHGVPRWHASMLSDTARSDAYERAIRRAVRPDCVVLDIGSGSGLLAMMAARAGARRVYTCEAVPAVAETAREIIAANGLSERITVFAKHSTELDRDRDLDGGADLIVSEIISDNMLCEGVIGSLDHAARELARPNATFIPHRTSMRVALVHYDQILPRLPQEVSGFDVSLFERHVPSSYSVPVGHKRLQVRSETKEFLPLRFGPEAPPHPAQDHVVLTAHGPVNGLVQWLHLHLDEQDTYENAPRPGAFSAWGLVFHQLPDALTEEDARRIGVYADHDGMHPRFWFTRA
jgi:type II protein arginine methyltransferase